MWCFSIILQIFNHTIHFIKRNTKGVPAKPRWAIGEWQHQGQALGLPSEAPLAAGRSSPSACPHAQDTRVSHCSPDRCCAALHHQGAGYTCVWNSRMTWAVLLPATWKAPCVGTTAGRLGPGCGARPTSPEMICDGLYATEKGREEEKRKSLLKLWPSWHFWSTWLQLAVFRGVFRWDLLLGGGLSLFLAGDCTFHCWGCGGGLSGNDKHKMSLPWLCVSALSLAEKGVPM